MWLSQLTIAVALGLLIAIGGSSKLSADVQDNLAEGMGVYLLHVRGAMNSLIAAHFLALSRGETLLNTGGSPLLADAEHPTLKELRDLRFLPPDFPDNSPLNIPVQINLTRSAGSCPGVGCRIEALVYTSTALRRAGDAEPDYVMVAAAIRAMDGLGGAAWDTAPAVIRGVSFNRPNPVSAGGGVVGTVAGLDTTMWHQFVRIGDDRDPSLQGNLSVVGATTVQRLGIRERVQPNSACTLTNLANQATPALAPVNLPDNIEYATTTTGGIATCVGGTWRSVAIVAAAGGVCGNAAYPEGSTAVDVGGTGLLCRDGTWSPLSQWLSRHVRMATYLIPGVLNAGATNNVITKPMCGTSGGVAGIPRVEVVPQAIQNRGAFALTGSRNGDNISVSGTMTLDPTNFPTTDSGSTWRVGVPPNSQAIAQSYCVYS